MGHYTEELRELAERGNTRVLPDDSVPGMVDLSSNDYLGLAADTQLTSDFLGRCEAGPMLMTSSASRLLGAVQSPYRSLEELLSGLYQREATVLFNSGYHANVGLIQAISTPGSRIVADRLVHASIIDGMRLAGVPFTRSRHNDMAHVDHLVGKALEDGARRVIVIAESVYSMDGDRGAPEGLIDIKLKYGADRVILYVDEAHAVGVEGPRGLGLVAASPRGSMVDIVVGTFGKALASVGAFATFADGEMARWCINAARSLIFSTALPPLNIRWTEWMVRQSLGMDSRREHLKSIARKVTDAVNSLTGSCLEPSHIIPIIVGDSVKAVELSRRLAAEGFKVLPIRTPTVPPGTERLRVSLSAALTDAQIDSFIHTLRNVLG